jgi:ABC-2 type transport system ATP-binding protein/lipopolysaccharide transport system ATP-binding protein
MGRNVIEMEQVGKRYFLGEHHGSGRTLREAISDRMRNRHPRDVGDIWSLRDIDLEIAEGEAVGVLGRNGAGKSTLLKILTRITEPTTGVSRTRGRVGALLEVGTGFHPELTGRENIFLNGAILGMRRREIFRQFDEIVAFAGVERFVDTPVKRYSSGMYLRLAFAVAAHLDADILAVDEVLAVGDAEFQRKCLGKMAEVERSGRTVLFVSHNLDAIVRLCPTSIWLEQGRVVARGPSAEVVDQYMVSGVRRTGVAQLEATPGEDVSLLQVSVSGPDGEPTGRLDRDEPITIEIRFDVAVAVPDLDFSVIVQNLRGIRIVDEAWSDTVPHGRGVPGRYIGRLTIPPVLNAGEYSVAIWIGTAYQTFVWLDSPVTFRLEGDTQNRPERIVQLGLRWDVRSGPGPRRP